MNIKKLLLLGMIVFASLSLFGEDEGQVLRLNLGDKNLKDKTMTISADKIFSTQKGKPVSFPEMIREMEKSRFVYVGETHNSLPIHDIQLKVIRALHTIDKNLSVGLEMFPVSSQEVLNKWSLAILTPEEFIQESRWYVHWNLNFKFYENIFLFTKENKIPLYALNAPRPLIHKIRMKGWVTLSDEEKTGIPEPDLTHPEHRKLIRAIFESTPIPHRMKGKGLEMAFEGLYRAQSAWDEVMAFNAVSILQREDTRLVILAGSGHLLYNLGINRRAFERTPLPFTTLVCVEIPEEEEGVMVSRSLADFIWGLPEEERPAFPSIGLSLKKIEGLENLVIESEPTDGVAKASGFKKGDVILSVDGQQYSDINLLRIYLSRFGWNDEVSFRLLREAQALDVSMIFHPPQKEGVSEEKKWNNIFGKSHWSGRPVIR